MRRVDVRDIEWRDYCYYVDGVPFTGIGVEYYPDGRLRCEMSFENGIHQGQSRDWYPSGTMMQQADYRHNTLHGELTEWTESGRLIRRETYEFGICTANQGWDDDGNLVSEFRLTEDDPHYSILRMFRVSRFAAGHDRTQEDGL